MAPICARNAAARSCCCAAWRVAARANPGGNSPSTSAPAPIAAIICNHSRRVLLVTLPLTVHLPLEVRCNMSRVHSRARVRLRQDQPLVFELDVRLSENVRERDQRDRHDAAPLPRVWRSRCGDAPTWSVATAAAPHSWQWRGIMPIALVSLTNVFAEPHVELENKRLILAQTYPCPRVQPGHIAPHLE